MEPKETGQNNLAQKKCIPCEAGGAALSGAILDKYVASVPGWQLEESKKIKKEFKFKDFKGSIGFVNKIADIAETEGHHPSIFISYNKVRVTLITHAIGGLSENDFIMAAKIDNILGKT